MVSTLVTEADEWQVRYDIMEKKHVDSPTAGELARVAAEQNKAQQIQLAKRLLLMQLSDFRQVNTRKVNGEKVTESKPWEHSMAVALSHCSRVVFTLPKVEQIGENKQEHHDRMWRAINFGIDGSNMAQDNPRTASTHSIERRKVGDTRVGSKEKKVLFNLVGQRGMNIAIGGLGKLGVGQKTLNNDGSCGHVYSMHKTADFKNYGAMIMGIESDEAGVMNQMGHVHDIHATPEKASSFGGQRTDEIGDKYGGRQCDLSGMSASDITLWLNMLEIKMKQIRITDEQKADHRKLMEILSGAKMTAENLTWVKGYLGMPA